MKKTVLTFGLIAGAMLALMMTVRRLALAKVSSLHWWWMKPVSA